MKKYLKSLKWLFLITLLVSGITFNIGISNARQNAYVCTLYDNIGYAWKAFVICSGNELEKNNITGKIAGEYNIFNSISAGNYSGKHNDSACGEDMHITLNSDGTLTYGSFIFGEDNAEKTDYAPNTFPCSEGEVTVAGINRANVVAQTLNDSLNEAMSYLNDGDAYLNEDYFLRMTYALMSGDTVINNNGNRFTISYDTSANHKYVTITRNDKEKKKFVYRLKKGYTDGKGGASGVDTFEDGTDNLLATDTTNLDTEVVYISWQRMVAEALVLDAANINYANQNELYEAGAVEESLVSLLGHLLDGVKNILNLYSIDDLVFNSGIRSSSAYYYGAFPISWSNNIVVFYLICSVIAFSFLGIILVKLIIQRSLATTMPMVQVSLMNGIKNIIVSCMVISMGIPIAGLLFQTNFYIVDIFKNLADVGTNGALGTEALKSYNGLFAGLIISLVYFGIELYVNYFYIVRGITLASLFMSAPLWIMLGSSGTKGKELCGAWLKEFMGTLFIQSIHALVFAFLSSSAYGLRTVESLVLMACIIPLNNMFRQFIGNGGGLLSKAATSASGATAGAIGATAGAITKGAGSSLSGIGESLSRGNSGARGISSVSGGLSDNIQGKIGSTFEKNQGVGGIMDSVNRSNNNIVGSTVGNGIGKLGVGGGMGTAASGLKAVGSALSGASNLGSMGAGVAMAGALGFEDAGMMSAGTGMVNRGLSNIAGDVGKTVGAGAEGIKAMGANVMPNGLTMSQAKALGKDGLKPGQSYSYNQAKGVLTTRSNFEGINKAQLSPDKQSIQVSGNLTNTQYSQPNSTLGKLTSAYDSFKAGGDKEAFVSACKSCGVTNFKYDSATKDYKFTQDNSFGATAVGVTKNGNLAYQVGQGMQGRIDEAVSYAQQHTV